MDRFAASSARLCAALAALVFASASAQPVRRLPAVALNAGIHAISAEVARTDQQRATGLMHRTTLASHEGMLFVFDAPAVQCFWMRNTLVPLSVAFLADDGTVVNIADMKPQTLDSHCSRKPVRFALEMNQGWFERRGVKPGTRIDGAPFKR